MKKKIIELKHPKYIRKFIRIKMSKNKKSKNKKKSITQHQEYRLENILHVF